jgi:predicted glycoside hydrolase/deacetylase ChbG (UPF0249 family)
MAKAARALVVVADDYGMGPETSRGILELAQVGAVTATVLLVNSPHAEDAVRHWQAAAPPADLGWHPCLTMDRPLSRPEDVPTLVGPDGRMGPLSRFLSRLLAGRIHAAEVRRELLAQYQRFRDLTGSLPLVVNTHHHVAAFSPVGAVLGDILREQAPRPFLRRVREPWRQLLRVRGARFKRTALTLFGRAQARRQEQDGFPGASVLAGVGSPSQDPAFFRRWLRQARGAVVELMCHPGWPDTTLLQRDLDSPPWAVEARAAERHWLAQEEFRQECRRAGFQLARPGSLLQESGVRSQEPASGSRAVCRLTP